MNLPRIINGHVKELTGQNQPLFDIRYAICEQCEHKKQEIYGETCGLCGCRLEAKLRVDREICPDERWLPVGNVNI